ncbi:hypothetical protein RMATCC62417_00563 [Rhizopus microsporus]|nr:hypothetical protein RMATCC62417_00563 [Rhizopus microsporus]
MIYLSFFLILLTSLIHALPITTNSITSPITTTITNTHFTPIIQEEEEKIDDNSCSLIVDYPIQIEHFAQLIATHWQFDHLDTIITKTYRTIAEQFQKHIQVSSTSSSDSRQHTFASPDNLMDLEILHAQIFGAIQAHTEGNLPLAWDRLADKLGRPALESYIRTKALEYCKVAPDLVSSTCLQQNAVKLSLEMDEYIRDNLREIYTILDNETLPVLLEKTSKDLMKLLEYFNRTFLSRDNQQLVLDVIPWSERPLSLTSQLMPSFSMYHHDDNHITDFFIDYACLSKA